MSSSARAVTAPGINPSPQALSTGPGRGSRSSTSRPARAAYKAVAIPTGPPPATTRSGTSRLLEGRQSGVLHPDPDRQQHGVEDREHDRGDPAGVHQRQRGALEHDGDV